MNEQIIVPTEAAGHLVNVLKNRLSVVEANNKALYTQIEHQVLVIVRLEKHRDELLEALELADALLSGANMNKNVVEKKVKTAIDKAKEK